MLLSERGTNDREQVPGQRRWGKCLGAGALMTREQRLVRKHLNSNTFFFPFFFLTLWFSLMPAAPSAAAGNGMPQFHIVILFTCSAWTALRPEERIVVPDVLNGVIQRQTENFEIVRKICEWIQTLILLWVENMYFCCSFNGILWNVWKHALFWTRVR